MKTATALLLVLSAAAALPAAEPLQLADPAPKVETLDNPCRYVNPDCGCIVRDPKGDVHVVMPYNTRWRGPVQVGDFNLTRATTRLTEMDSTARPRGGIVMLDDGRLVMHAYGVWPCHNCYYNTLTGEMGGRIPFTDPFDKSGWQSVAIGDDGAIYLGGDWGGMIGFIAPQDTEIINVLPIRERALTGSPYVYSMGADRRWIYCEIGQRPWYLMIYDRLTGERSVHFMGQFGFVLRGSRDGKLYYQFTSGREKGKLFRLERGQPIPLPREEAAGIALNPRWLKTNVYPVEHASDADFGFEVRLEDMFPTQWNNGRSELQYRAEGERDWRRLVLDNVKLYPRTIKRMAWLPNGHLIGFGDFYGPVFTYDPATGATKEIGPPYGNTYGLLVEDPFVYTIGYPTFNVVYDTRKPYHQEKTVKPITNPVPMGMPGHVTGTYLAKGADGRIYGVWKHARRSTGAHLAAWDPATRKGEIVVRDKDRIMRHLVALDGGRLLVMSTQHARGREPATLATYHTATGKATFGPELPFSVWSKLAPCGPGRVFGISQDGWMFRVNVAKRALDYTKKLPEDDEAFGKGHIWDWEIAAGPDGWVWAILNQNQLCRINPADATVQKVTDIPAAAGSDYHTRFLFKGKDLYLYGEHLSRLRGLFR